MDLLRIVPLLRFRCAGIPTYSLLGELARGDELQTLHPGGRYGSLGAHRIQETYRKPTGNHGLSHYIWLSLPVSFPLNQSID